MKSFFSRYSHWVGLIIVGFSFSTMFIDFTATKPNIIAALFGGVGLLSVVYLAVLAEKQIRKQKNEK